MTHGTDAGARGPAARADAPGGRAPNTDPAVETDQNAAASGPSGPAAGETRLDRLREEIGRVDRELIGLIGRRVEIAREVGEAKRAAGLPTLDPAREAAVVRRAGELAREAGLHDEDVRYIFWHLIGLSRRAQLEGE